jgi:hypothetical protein
MFDPECLIAIGSIEYDVPREVVAEIKRLRAEVHKLETWKQLHVGDTASLRAELDRALADKDDAYAEGYASGIEGYVDGK